MEQFVSKYRRPNSPEAYDAYLKTIRADDPSRPEAIERRDRLRFEPYKARGTRAALAEFVKKYPDTAVAQKIRAETILDDTAAGALLRATGALDDLETALTVGINFQEYARRLVDAKIQVLRALSEAGDQLPRGAREEVTSAIVYYERALGVWNWKIQNVRWHSHRYEDGYMYMGDEPEVIAWLNYCPEAKMSEPQGLLIAVNTGTWFPGIVQQCYWRDARSELAKAKARLSGP